MAPGQVRVGRDARRGTACDTFHGKKLSAMCERAGWRVRHIGTFNGLAPFLAPISRRLALGLEQIEFSFNRLLPQNLLFCVCTRDV